LWMNGQYIRQLGLDELYAKTKNVSLTGVAADPHSYWPPEAAEYDDAYRKQVLGLIQERLKYLAEVPELTVFFFKDLPVDPSLISTHKQLKKVDAGELYDLLVQSREVIAGSDFSVDDLTDRLNTLLDSTGQKPAVLFSLIRIAITQSQSSPGLADTLHVLGKERSLARIDAQLAAWSS
jgi:glutamyl/glutaminyl-tRNA synthetase